MSWVAKTLYKIAWLPVSACVLHLRCQWWQLWSQIARALFQLFKQDWKFKTICAKLLWSKKVTKIEKGQQWNFDKLLKKKLIYRSARRCSRSTILYLVIFEQSENREVWACGSNSCVSVEVKDPTWKTKETF